MMRNAIKDCSQPLYNLLHLNVPAAFLQYTWMSPTSFPSLTSLSLIDSTGIADDSATRLCNFVQLRTLKIFSSYDRSNQAILPQLILPQFFHFKNLESLALININNEEKNNVVQLLESGILDTLKQLTVLLWFGWKDEREIDQVLAPLCTSGSNKLTALCIGAHPDKFPASKIIQSFRSVLYVDTVSNIKKNSMFLA